MNTNRPSKARVRLVAAGLMFAATGCVFAAQQSTTSGQEPSKETREQMAKLHEEMATCLRSTKSVADCRNQMRSHCASAMGEEKCRTMGQGMKSGGHERMHEQGSQTENP